MLSNYITIITDYIGFDLTNTLLLTLVVLGVVVVIKKKGKI